jgi:hypothetical protein
MNEVEKDVPREAVKLESELRLAREELSQVRRILGCESDCAFKAVVERLESLLPAPVWPVHERRVDGSFEKGVLPAPDRRYVIVRAVTNALETSLELKMRLMAKGRANPANIETLMRHPLMDAILRAAEDQRFELTWVFWDLPPSLRRELRRSPGWLPHCTGRSRDDFYLVSNEVDALTLCIGGRPGVDGVWSHPGDF